MSSWVLEGIHKKGQPVWQSAYLTPRTFDEVNQNSLYTTYTCSAFGFPFTNVG